MCLLLFGGAPNETFFNLCRYQISVGAFGAQHKMYYFDVALIHESRTQLYEVALKGLRHEQSARYKYDSK